MQKFVNLSFLDRPTYIDALKSIHIYRIRERRCWRPHTLRTFAPATNGFTMNNDYINTVVMDVNPHDTSNKKPAAAVAEKIQASINERNETSSEEDFSQTYSYLT